MIKNEIPTELCWVKIDCWLAIESVEIDVESDPVPRYVCILWRPLILDVLGVAENLNRKKTI